MCVIHHTVKLLLTNMRAFECNRVSSKNYTEIHCFPSMDADKMVDSGRSPYNFELLPKFD